MTTEPNGTGAAGRPLRDRREQPRGVLPRQLQMWLMASLAAVIVLIILIVGHSEPPARASGTTRPATTTLPDADRIRAYQQQLAEDEVRLRQVQQEAMTTTRPSGAGGGSPRAAENDPVKEEARRRDYQSLFADNVALSRRPTGQQPSGENGSRPSASSAGSSLSPETQAVLQALAQLSPRASVPPAGFTPAPADVALVSTAQSGSSPKDARDENPAPGPRLRLLEGTVIETVLLNRLDGTFAGPVSCLVTTPVYSHDRQTMLIPAGARVLGAAAPVQAWGDARLAVSFHRLVMPDGHTYSLDRFTGLDQLGATGLKDDVNRHYGQVFGASLAIGALSGLAQYHTRGFDANTFSDTYRQAAGASLASSSTRVLDRYLNVLPTITIREGFRIKVYLTNDLELPAYDAGAGGVR
jgi:type IV secretory pathway VirB10-like protein